MAMNPQQYWDECCAHIKQQLDQQQAAAQQDNLQVSEEVILAWMDARKRRAGPPTAPMAGKSPAQKAASSMNCSLPFFPI